METPNASRPARWIRDVAIDLRSDDQFGVSDLTDRLVELLAVVEPPFTMSLSGSWGVGKSTVAKAAKERLEDSGIRALLIDAWTLDVGSLRRRVVVEVGAALQAAGKSGRIEPKAHQDARDTVAGKLDDARAAETEVQAARIELRDPKKIRETLSAHKWVVAAAFMGALAAVALTVLVGKDSGLQPVFGGVATVLLSLLLSSFVFKIVTPSRTRAPAKEELQLAAAFERFVTGKDEKGDLIAGDRGYTGPVVVVIDNLDRLSGEDALTALAEIRSFVEVDGSRCVFFIPIDRRRLAEHLGRKLSDAAASADFLEKFFNLDLALVQPEPIDLHKWAFDHCRELFREQSEPEVRAASEIVVSAARRSPRAITRMMNGLVTRQLALADAAPVPLRQLALVEGLLSFVPSMADPLALEPHILTDARESLAVADNEVTQLEALEPLVDSTRGIDEESRARADQIRRELRLYLLSNPDVPLDRQQLRSALTLRKDRLWKDVPEADLLDAALTTGDQAAFERGLDGRTAPEKRAVFERVAQFVDRNRSSNRMIARALSAAAAGFAEQDDLNQRVYPIAVGAMATAEASLMRTLNRAAVQFLFGQGDVAGKVDLRQKLVAAIWEPGGEHLAPMVFGARLAASQFTAEQADHVRTSLATRSEKDLAPLFEEPPCVPLIKGEVSSAMLTLLGSWDPATGAHERVVRLAELLVIANGAGWDDPAGLDNLASMTQPKVAILVPETASLDALDAICRLLSHADPSAEIDQLGAALATAQEVGSTDLFRSALRLPLQPPILTGPLATSLGSWMDGMEPARIAPLLEVARGRVEAALPGYRDRLLNRWEQDADVEFAHLAIGGEPAEVPLLQTRWAAVQPPNSLARAVEALDLIAEVGDKPALTSFVAAVAVRLAAIPTAAFAELPAFTRGLRDHSVGREPIVEALEARVRGITTPAELLEAFDAVAGTGDIVGPVQRARLADTAMERFVAFGMGDDVQAHWIVEHASTTQLMASLVAQLVARGLAIDSTLAVVDRARTRGLESPEVFDALVSRAAGEAEESDAEQDLKVAEAWSRPGTPDSESAAANLREIANRFPNLKTLVQTLRQSLT